MNSIHLTLRAPFKASALAISALFAFTASASEIVPPLNVNFYGAASGTGSATVVTATPGGTAGNFLNATKTFNTFSPGGGAQIVFGMASSPTTTNYLFTETVTNNTTSTWDDYHFGIGCGNTGENLCGAINPIRFDPSVTPTISPGPGFFTQVMPTLDWTGISVAPGATVTFTFGISTCVNCGGNWAIFQRPSLVPEPATTALFTAGALVLLARRRYRQAAPDRADEL